MPHCGIKAPTDVKYTTVGNGRRSPASPVSSPIHPAKPQVAYTYTASDLVESLTFMPLADSTW